MTVDQKSIVQMLAGAGLRRTPVRLGVLQLLADAPDPLAVTQILERLPEHTDAVTVYRTLNTFTRKKLVHRIRGEDRGWRYALSGSVRSPQHQHPHFVCTDCGRVQCLESAHIPEKLVQKLQVDDDYAVSYVEVVLHGQCPRCKA